LGKTRTFNRKKGTRENGLGAKKGQPLKTGLKRAMRGESDRNAKARK